MEQYRQVLRKEAEAAKKSRESNAKKMKELFITGAGVSSASGIPTFRGSDGFWTVGSVNYTPQEMATRYMYENYPDQFLLWYFKRFIAYKDAKPNFVHKWLSNKNLITQNIDGLDAKAGNKNYISIHGRLDKVIIYQDEMEYQIPTDANWNEIDPSHDDNKLISSWLPSDNDKKFINSLMIQELNPSKTASWITKPKRGINNQDIEFDYVDLK